MVDNLIKFCKSYSHIYIYGAGKYGRIACMFLEENGVSIEGFVVSEGQKGNLVLGHIVYVFSDISEKINDESTGIIVAMKKEIAQTVERLLCSNQNRNYIVINDDQDIQYLLSKLQFTYDYKFKNNVLALVYHRVGDIGFDTRNLSMQEDVFERQMIYLKNNYNLIRSEEEWDETAETSVLITFDDGYCDFYNTILPILEKNKIPATVFIATGNIGTKNEFWGDVLEYLVLHTNKNDVTFLDKKYPMATEAEKIQSMFLLRNVLKNTSGIQRSELLSDLSNVLDVKAEPRITHRTMTENEIIDCSKSPYVTIGAHTRTHCCLSYEDKEVQYNEIYSSKKDLEKIIGKEVKVFAYPYGERNDFNDETISIAKKIGFKRVFAAYEGMASFRTEYGRIPRNNISLYSDLGELIRRIQEIRCIYGDSYV